MEVDVANLVPTLGRQPDCWSGQIEACLATNTSAVVNLLDDNEVRWESSGRCGEVVRARQEG